MDGRTDTYLVYGKTRALGLPEAVEDARDVPLELAGVVGHLQHGCMCAYVCM